MATNRPHRAAQLHLRRSELWQHNPKQLFSVAYGIAVAANSMSKADPERRSWYVKAKTVLENSVDSEAELLEAEKVDRLLSYLGNVVGT